MQAGTLLECQEEKQTFLVESKNWLPRAIDEKACCAKQDPPVTTEWVHKYIIPHINLNPNPQPPRSGMTTLNRRFRLPDPPQREPDEMTQYDQLFKRGDSHALAVHLGNPESTLVEADRWIVARPEHNKARARRPDLLVAFGVDPDAYRVSNGYGISEQGKPPDLVLEVASESTADEDIGPKQLDYEALGVGEYWRFDETGEHHGTKLAGDMLVEGRYEQAELEELANGVLQGYSPALNLHLRWEDGALSFHDPTTGEPIATLESERNRAEAERIRADTERRAREAAEARVRELEERYGERPSGE